VIEFSDQWKDLSLDDWYYILKEDFKRYCVKYDTVTINSVHQHDNIGKVRINYKTNNEMPKFYNRATAPCITSFGVLDVDKNDIPALVRQIKIENILNKNDE